MIIFSMIFKLILAIMLFILSICFLLMIPLNVGSMLIYSSIAKPIFPFEESAKVSRYIKKGFFIQAVSVFATAMLSMMMINGELPDILVTLATILFSPLTLFVFLPLILHQLRDWHFEEYATVFYGVSVCGGISSIVSAFCIPMIYLSIF